MYVLYLSVYTVSDIGNLNERHRSQEMKSESVQDQERLPLSE